MTTTWDENLHPRAAAGQFAEKAGSAPETSLHDAHQPSLPDRPAQIAAARAADTSIAAAWDAYWEARKPIEDAARTIVDARKRLRTTRSPETYQDHIAVAEARIAAAQPAADAARLDAELYTGWKRFYLVQHIHSSQTCSSFRPTTRVGWLPDLSGLTEAEAVAEHGAILCTICFPSAPTEWTEGPKDDRCAGAGKPINHDLPERTGFYSGNWATCPDCGKQVGVSRTGFRIPKHQALSETEPGAES